MDSSLAAGQPVAAEIAPSARALGRDALLFLLISAVGLFVVPAAVAVAGSIVGLTVSVYDDFQSAAAASVIVGWAGGVVTALAGLWKIEKARAAGLKTRGAKWTQAALLLVTVVAAMVAQARFEGSVPAPAEHPVFWAMPLIAILIQIFRSLESQENRADVAWRAFCFLAVGHLCSIYALALACAIDPRLSDGCGIEKITLAALYNADGGQFAAMLCGPFVLMAYALGLWNFFLARRSRAEGFASRWAARMMWLLVALALSETAWFCVQGKVAYATELIAIWTIFTALTVGKYAARIGAGGPPSRVRRICFTLPLLLLAGGAIMTIGVLGSAYETEQTMYRMDSFTPAPYASHDWAWKLPEFIRGPIARLLKRSSAGLEEVLLIGALLPEEDLSQAALGGKSASGRNFVYWMVWSSRNSNAALQAALAVPVASDPVIPETKYDLSAGITIGANGSNDDIRRRFEDSYSDELVDGVMIALGKDKRGLFLNEIQARIEQLPRADRMAWFALAEVDPQRMQDLLLKFAQNPTSLNHAKVEISRNAWRKLKDSESVIRAMLKSDDVGYRKTALQNCWELVGMTALHDIILTAAKGKLPNSDADEQRLAAKAICTQIPLVWQNWRPGPFVSPLTSAEQVELQRIIAAFIAKHGVAKP